MIIIQNTIRGGSAELANVTITGQNIAFSLPDDPQILNNIRYRLKSGNCTFMNATIQNCEFNSLMSSQVFISNSISQCIFTGLFQGGANQNNQYSGVRFIDATFQGTTFQNSTFENCIFENVSLLNVTIFPYATKEEFIEAVGNQNIINVTWLDGSVINPVE